MKIIRPLLFLAITIPLLLSAQKSEMNWRYYRPGNTGIQGDYATALWLDEVGNPYIAANTGNWGEGGFAVFNVLQDQWSNFSNVDYPVLGSFEDADVQLLDIVEDHNHNLWMGNYSGALFFNPTEGIGSAIRYTSANSQLQGNTYDVDVAPDGSIWFAGNGTSRYDPVTGEWQHWPDGNVRLSVQTKPDGSYLVWTADYYYGYVTVYNSTSQEYTTYLPETSGQIAGLPGKDCSDDSGNFWALRMGTGGDFETLEYQQPDGTWVYPEPPYINVSFYIDAFKAFGNRKAAMVLASGEVWLFDGSNWNNLGTWRPGTNNLAVDVDANSNVWVCGIEGAAMYKASTGEWQRYRITNTSQIDYFVQDMTFDNEGNIWMSGNAGSGVGGFQKFDGEHWTGFNPYTYGLGHDFPFLADNTQAVTFRPSNNSIVFNPTFSGIYAWNGQDYDSIEPILSTSKGFAEDSGGRLWSLEEYFGVRYYDDISGEWNRFEITGWGQKITKDPVLPSTIWAMADFEVRRTNGVNNFSMKIEDFPSGDSFTGLALDSTGSVWVGTWSQFNSNGSTLVHMNPSENEFQIWEHDNGWPFEGEHVRPLLVSPDGKLWLQYDSEYPSEIAGICSFDGTTVVNYPSAPGGIPQWGGLPNSTIKDAELRVTETGYELWLSCLGRGIAVLKISYSPSSGKIITRKDSEIFRIWPNPSQGNIHIKAEENLTDNEILINVYDILGKKLYETNRKSNALSSKGEIGLDLSFLPDGIYTMQFVLENQIVDSKKILIAK